jgi:small subunit ribosomal protein S27e
MPNTFLKVKCECRNEQIIFSRASTTVKCTVCGAVLAEPTGGIANMKVPVVQSLQ